MYFYILFGILIAKAVEPFSSCDRSKINAANNHFKDLSNAIINLDKKVQDTCKQFPTFAAREVFGTNAFRLEIDLPEFSNAAFVVKVKHRVIYINGHYPGEGKTCNLTYVDIKILPEFVSTHAGSWAYKDGMLVVAFPYSQIGEENDVQCNNYIDETIIHLRRGFPNEQIFSDI